MCGRFSLHASAQQLMDTFGVLRGMPSDLPARYNIAPTQTVLAIRQVDVDSDAEYCRFRWGLIPSWADGVSIGARLANARSDGVASKPSFRAAFKKRRCLVLADGYYEWRPISKTKKQPYYFQRVAGKPFAFAGLWETWTPKEGDAEPVESCSLITCDANEQISAIHDRMPVILDAADYPRWLWPSTPPDVLQELLKPSTAKFTVTPVSSYVSNARNQGPQCIEGIELP